MSFTRTATTDGFGRSVQITNGRFVATMMTGLLPVADRVSRIQLLAPFEQALEQTHKPKDRSLYSAGAMFRQRVFAHICGFEDLADHDVITEDEGFLSALGVNDAAGSSTLCRFENSITRHDLDRLNCCFLDALLRANRKHRIFPRPGARKTPVLTTTGMAHRTIGELVNYKAKSWKQERRLIARRQHDARTNQMDLRLIQTNIKHVKKGGKTAGTESIPSTAQPSCMKTFTAVGRLTANSISQNLKRIALAAELVQRASAPTATA